MTRRGRPRRSLGVISEAVLSLASVRPITSIDVALELQLSRSVARSTLSRLRDIGHVRQHAVVVVAGSKKPLHQVVATQARIAEPSSDLLFQWVRAARASGGEA